MTGLEVLRRLREGGGEDLDVIVISAARDLDTLRTALRGGVFQYLVKPFEIESLQQRLGEYAAHRAELAELTEVGQDDVDRVFRASGARGRGRLAQGHQPGDDGPGAPGARGAPTRTGCRRRSARSRPGCPAAAPGATSSTSCRSARQRCARGTARPGGPSVATGFADGLPEPESDWPRLAGATTDRASVSRTVRAGRRWR